MNINKKNLLGEMLEHLDQHLDQFKCDDVIGISLNGGLSRGYGDHLSEVDVTIYYSDLGYRKFEKGLIDIKEGICVIDQQLYDVKIVNFEKESIVASIYTELWDLSHAKVLYDPSGQLRKLLSKRLKREVTYRDTNGPMFSAWWYFKLACDIWLYRENYYQGHFILNEGSKKILEAIYLANKSYVPHEKWLVHNLYTLEWLPMSEQVLVSNLLGTSNFSLSSLKTRQKFFVDMYEMIDRKIHEVFELSTDLEVSKLPYYEMLTDMIKYGEFTIEEFDEKYGLKLMHSEPFASLLTIEGNRIFIDLDKVEHIGPNEMYKWHYDVVTAVRKNR